MADGKGPTLWDWVPRLGAVDDGTNGVFCSLLL